MTIHRVRITGLSTQGCRRVVQQTVVEVPEGQGEALRHIFAQAARNAGIDEVTYLEDLGPKLDMGKQDGKPLRPRLAQTIQHLKWEADNYRSEYTTEAGHINNPQVRWRIACLEDAVRRLEK